MKTLQQVEPRTDVLTLRALAAGTGGAFSSASASDLRAIYQSLAKELAGQYLVRYRSGTRPGSQVEITLTNDGLRIELLETEAGMFFESGKAQPTPTGSELLSKLAAEMGRLPNKLLIEGHTDAKPFSGERGYTNWELSTDRANAARKIMEAAGVRPVISAISS